MGAHRFVILNVHESKHDACMHVPIEAFLFENWCEYTQVCAHVYSNADASSTLMPVSVHAHICSCPMVPTWTLRPVEGHVCASACASEVTGAGEKPLEALW